MRHQTSRDFKGGLTHSIQHLHIKHYRNLTNLLSTTLTQT